MICSRDKLENPPTDPFITKSMFYKKGKMPLIVRVCPLGPTDPTGPNRPTKYAKNHDPERNDHE